MPCVIICTLRDLVRHNEDGLRRDRNMSVNSNMYDEKHFAGVHFLVNYIV